MSESNEEIQDILTDIEPQEELGMGWKILAFLVPIAGAIMYFNHKDKNNLKSKSACTAALWGIGFGILLNVLTAMGRG